MKNIFFCGNYISTVQDTRILSLLMSSDLSHCSILNGPPCCPDYGIECKYLPFCRKIVKYLVDETTHPDDDKDYHIYSLVLLDMDLNFRSSELFGIVI